MRCQTQTNSPRPGWPSSAILNRREMLCRLGGGFGYLALTSLLAEETIRSASFVQGASEKNLLMVKPPHFPAKAKRVISLFMNGGPSQMDTFDPKPRLQKDHGKKPSLDFSNSSALLLVPEGYKGHYCQGEFTTIWGAF
jgi:Protein of unknown function (DUF1501)